MNTTLVLKFGGSSVSNDEKLHLVAKKIIEFAKENKRIVVILSAQGNMTDELIAQAKKLSKNPDERELDSLMSVGEQISVTKMAILLKELGQDAISFCGWQIPIQTSKEYGEAKIEQIYTARIEQELEEKIVIIAGFQGIDLEGNITTLGRDGSDTTAVAIAAALQTNDCYIFSDVDGVYDKNPQKYKKSKKLEILTYDEMLKLSESGANVLQDRSVKIAKKYNITLHVLSAFKNEKGSIVCQNKK